MIIKSLFISLLALFILVTDRLSFSMQLVKELVPTDTIVVKNGTITSCAFDKNKSIVNLLLSKKNKYYLSRYNLETKFFTLKPESINKKSDVLKLFAPSDCLLNNVGPYAVNYTDEKVEIWEMATKKHLYNLLCSASSASATFNKNETKVMAASKDGIIKIWQLKKPIIFQCNKSYISIEDTTKNWKILSQSETIKSMLAGLDFADLNSEIPLLYISNRNEFDSLFRLMKLVCMNNIKAVKKELNNLNFDQLFSLVKQSSFYDIAGKKINLTDCICKVIAEKYKSSTDRFCSKQMWFFRIKQLSLDLQNIIARHIVNDLSIYINHNNKPLFYFNLGLKICVYSAAFSPNGKTVVIGSDNGVVTISDVATGECLETFYGEATAVCSVGFSSDGKILITGFCDNAVKILDVETGVCVYNFDRNNGIVYSVAFSSNGEKIVIGGSDETVKMWDLKSRKCTKIFAGHTGTVNAVVVSQDDKIILTGSGDKTVRIWNAQTGECEQVFKGHMFSVSSVALSPDNKTVLIGFEDGTVQIWDIGTEKCRQTFLGYSDAVTGIFSPDGKTVVVGFDDGTISLWDLETERCKQVFKHKDSIVSMAFSPDGNSLVAGSFDGVAHIWNIDNTGQQEFFNQLTIEQAEFLINDVYPVIKQDKIFEPISGSEGYSILMTMSPKAQKYLQDHIKIIAALPISKPVLLPKQPPFEHEAVMIDD